MIAPVAEASPPVIAGIVSFKHTVGVAVVIVPTVVMAFSTTVREAIALLQLAAPVVTSTLISSPPSIRIE